MPNSPKGEMDPTNPPIDDLGWLQHALFTLPGNVISPIADRSTPDGQIAWTALPLRGPTRRLVPTAARFAAQAFTNTHDAMSVTRRAAGVAARGVVRTGALRIGPRLYANAATVFDDPDRSVIAAAAQGLDQIIESCAITLGPRRYNRKPVVQLMNPRAETIGFLKVGADDITSAMVATEAAAIARLRTPGTPPLVVPRVLWQSEWNGRAVVCLSPVAAPSPALVPADDSRLATIAREVVTAGGGSRDTELRGSAAVNRLRQAAERDAHTALGQLLDRCEARFGNQTVTVGQWHGDFSPWNMISTNETTALIDWEFARTDMPIGADLLHHRLMVATHLDGQPAARPLHLLVGFGHNVPELHSLNVPSEQHRPHLLLYLFELVRRDLELQRANRPDTGFGAPARAAIETILSEGDR